MVALRLCSKADKVKPEAFYNREPSTTSGESTNCVHLNIALFASVYFTSVIACRDYHNKKLRPMASTADA